MSASLSVSLDDVKTARSAIAKFIPMSPLTRSPRLSASSGCEIYLKLENTQRTGAYKDRGAMNAVLNLDEQQRKAGVIAASAGNHAQGLASAAQQNGIHATIVMPETAPIAKLKGTEAFGAEVVLHGSGYDDAFGLATELQQEKGYAFVHAFDDPKVIAGAGTVGLELLDQNPDLEVFVVPIGGGGIIAGMAVALKEQKPNVRIVGVQSEHIAAMKVSVEAGKIMTVPGSTIADGIAVARPGEHTFPIVQRYVDEIVTVSEPEIAAAMLLLLESDKTVTEGSGAVGVAAIHYGKIDRLDGKQVGVVLTGGNIDTTFLAKILLRGLEKDGRLAKLVIVVPDRPGSFAEVAGIAAAHRANVIDLHQRRAFSSAQYRETEIEMLVETRGPEQAQELLDAIIAKGFRARSLESDLLA